MRGIKTTIDPQMAETDLWRQIHRFGIKLKAKKFLESKNPVHAIEAFLLAQEEGFAAPKSVLKCLQPASKNGMTTKRKSR